ncbi:MAG TPA: recombination mediator RecR [Thermoanaerobaculia bacterium]|nr:recombination mediator RecR [Thermoanaerobaculia bacterium]
MSAIDDLATELAKLPGIGRKTALRLTYHLLKQPAEHSQRLADALRTLSERVRPCGNCFNLTEDDVCDVCRDPRRDPAVICAVEEASDIGAIERAGEFRGLYHVLGGRLSPLDGVMPEDLTVPQLVGRVAAGGVREVIIATNPSLEGEATALYVQRQLVSHPVVVSRIARGLPVGGDLEYADGVTIAQALSARRAM